MPQSAASNHDVWYTNAIEILFQSEEAPLANPKTNISARIRHAREQARMEPAQLREHLRARGIELSKTGLHRLENTEPSNPNLKIIQAIAEITNLSPGWLLFGSGPSVPESEVSSAIRGRVIDTIELMSGALDMTKRQETTLANWLQSLRTTRPGKISRP